VRRREGYTELRGAIVANAGRALMGWNQAVQPHLIAGGVAQVSAANTAYDPRQRLLLSVFALETAPASPAAPGVGGGTDTPAA
jgi:hypothetical protein